MWLQPPVSHRFFPADTVSRGCVHISIYVHFAVIFLTQTTTTTEGAVLPDSDKLRPSLGSSSEEDKQQAPFFKLLPLNATAFDLPPKSTVENNTIESFVAGRWNNAPERPAETTAVDNGNNRNPNSNNHLATVSDEQQKTGIAENGGPPATETSSSIFQNPNVINDFLSGGEERPYPNKAFLPQNADSTNGTRESETSGKTRNAADEAKASEYGTMSPLHLLPSSQQPSFLLSDDGAGDGTVVDLMFGGEDDGPPPKWKHGIEQWSSGLTPELRRLLESTGADLGHNHQELVLENPDEEEPSSGQGQQKYGHGGQQPPPFLESPFFKRVEPPSVHLPPFERLIKHFDNVVPSGSGRTMMVGNSNSAGKGEEHDSPSTTAADGGYGYLSSSSLGVEDGIPPGQAGGLDDDYYLRPVKAHSEQNRVEHMLGELSLQGPAKLLLNDEEQPMGHGSSLASAGIFYRRTFGGGDRRFGQHRVGGDDGYTPARDEPGRWPGRSGSSRSYLLPTFSSGRRRMRPMGSAFVLDDEAPRFLREVDSDGFCAMEADCICPSEVADYNNADRLRRQNTVRVARSVDLDLDLLPSTEFSTTLLDLGNETTLDRFVDEMIQRLGKERRQWELETATLKCRPPCQCIPNCSPTMAVAAEREGLSPNDDPTNNQRNNKDPQTRPPFFGEGGDCVPSHAPSAFRSEPGAMGRFFSSSPPLDEQLPPAESIMDGSGSLSEGPVLPRVALPSADMKTELGFPPTTTAEEIPEQMIPIGSGSLLPATAGASGTGGGGGGISLDETSLLPAGFGRRSGLIKHAMPAVLNGQPAEAAELVANSGNLLGRGMKSLVATTGAVPPLGGGSAPTLDATAQAAAEHLLRRFLGPDNKFGAVHLIELPVPMDEERKKKVARRNATAVAVMKV